MVKYYVCHPCFYNYTSESRDSSMLMTMRPGDAKRFERTLRKGGLSPIGDADHSGGTNFAVCSTTHKGRP